MGQLNKNVSTLLCATIIFFSAQSVFVQQKQKRYPNEKVRRVAQRINPAQIWFVKFVYYDHAKDTEHRYIIRSKDEIKLIHNVFLHSSSLWEGGDPLQVLEKPNYYFYFYNKKDKEYIEYLGVVDGSDIANAWGPEVEKICKKYKKLAFAKRK